MNLAEKIQRDKSRDSSARGTTYILVEQSGREENGSMYNGRGLGLKGSAVYRRSSAGFEGVSRFEEASKRSKRHRRGSRGIGDFERGFEGFEGVSCDNYPSFKVAATRRNGDTRMWIDLRERSECVRS